MRFFEAMDAWCRRMDRDRWWSWRFAAYLFPLVMVASFLVYAIEGEIKDPPSVLGWVLPFVAGGVALWLTFRGRKR